jgi:hypothetical protein
MISVKSQRRAFTIVKLFDVIGIARSGPMIKREKKA